MYFLWILLTSTISWGQVVVIDSFVDNSSHGKKVVSVLKEKYKGEIIEMNVSEPQNLFNEELYFQALENTLQIKPLVLNLSLGGGAYIDREISLLKAIADAGTVVVVAAGNSNLKITSTSPLYPCSFKHPNVFCVGASEKNNKATFSNYGANVRVFSSGFFENKNFTSFSAPRVSATFAVAIQCGINIETIFSFAEEITIENTLKPELTNFNLQNWCYRPKAKDPF